MLNIRKVLKVVSAVKKKKADEHLVSWNHHYALENSDMNETLRDAWLEFKVRLFFYYYVCYNCYIV
jgi:hypothetical protein